MPSAPVRFAPQRNTQTGTYTTPLVARLGRTHLKGDALHALSRYSFVTFVLLPGLAALAQQPASRPAATDKAALQPASESAEPVAMARRFVGHLKADEFDAAFRCFDATVREQMPPEKLSEIWRSIEKSAGVFQAVGDPTVQVAGEYTVVVLPGTWKNAKLDIQVTVDRGGLIAGLFFRPAARGGEWKRPAYADPARFIETEVSIGDDPYKLPGLICIPRSKGPHPGVVLVHGSGPHDMDESIGPNKPFRDLAWGLASRGVAVLRYNKRTHSFPEQYMKEGPTAANEVITDAVLAVRQLRGRSELDASRLFVIGHSLGGCMAPMIARSDPDLAGFVSLSGTLRDLDVVVLEQLAHLANRPGPNQETIKKQLAQIRAEVDVMRAGSNNADDKIMNAPVSYWRDINAQLGQNGAAALGAFKGRVLILGGGRDYQITRVDFEHWRTAAGDRPSTTFQWLPDVNHLFFTGKGLATPEEYEKPGHVDVAVIDGLATWIKTGKWPEQSTQP